MSKESALQFLSTLNTNERAKELLKGKKKPESHEELAKIYSEIAAELGEQITPGDFIQTAQELEERIKQKTQAAASDLVAMKDDQVEDVAGGFYYWASDKYCSDYEFYMVENKCKNDFEDTSCWSSDACDNVIISYYDCSGNYHNYG